MWYRKDVLSESLALCEDFLTQTVPDIQFFDMWLKQKACWYCCSLTFRMLACILKMSLHMPCRQVHGSVDTSCLYLEITKSGANLCFVIPNVKLMRSATHKQPTRTTLIVRKNITWLKLGHRFGQLAWDLVFGVKTSCQFSCSLASSLSLSLSFSLSLAVSLSRLLTSPHSRTLSAGSLTMSSLKH